MSEENTTPYRTYLLRCWREDGDSADTESVWRFSIEEILGKRHRQGFGGLKEVVAFLQAELTDAR
jgi:hypothetical protein